MRRTKPRFNTTGRTPPGGVDKWRARLRLGAVGLAAGGLIAGAAACGTAAVSVSDHGPGLVVATADGALRGVSAGGTDRFLGIPYAAPPVGALRWRPPQPASPWKGVWDATAFAPHCAQPTSDFGVASTSENCLYLNVYTPPGDRNGRRVLPVMVWIHGGAFDWGESNDYNPAALVSHGVIVVTINYRLGALGFLADAALAGNGGASGDYGLMDEQAALRWVHQNIGNFGGDAGSVTLSGESAGGDSVLSQMASPSARGLFSKAIVESGAYALNPVSLATAESAGAAFATRAGCVANSAACLHTLPVATILADQAPAGYRPNLDGLVLPQSLTAAFTSGQFNRVPVINGSNHDEYRLFVGIYQLAGDPTTASNYQARIEQSLPGTPATAAAEIAAKYPLSAYPSPSLALGAVGTDAVFSCPALIADQLLARYVPTYGYELNDEHTPERYLPPLGFPYGAAHESELQYLFDLSNTSNPGVLTPQQRQLAASMKEGWTSFAEQGSPSSSSSSAGATWPAFHAASHQMLALVPSHITVETDFAVQHNCAFWANR